jgi:hypothetical protein
MTGIVSLPRPQLDAAYYRRRAQESRDLATKVPTASIREQMLDMAEGYDRIAERAESY